jgi:cytochrome P450
MAINLLAQHPDVQDKARNEVLRVMNGRSNPTYDDQKQFQYLDQVICETLRLFPPVSVLPPRELSEPIEFLGHTLPVGCVVSIPIYTIHRDPRYWQNPDTFDPDRFNPDRKYHPFAYQPFGHGIRGCLGVHHHMLSLTLTHSHSRSLRVYV